MVSLPIPEKNGSVRFGDITPQNVNVGKVVEDLTQENILASDNAHLDPDIDITAMKRATEWVPAFGQAGAATSHLRNQGVGLGDVFLFFGWFRRVESVMGRYRFCKDAPNLHVIFGWLRVGEVLMPSGNDIPKGLEKHPHFANPERKNNLVFLADSPADGGVFHHFFEELQLTAPEQSRSIWRLPGWFYPSGRKPLSYHGNLERWLKLEDSVMLKSAYRGQEFVLDLADYPEAHSWFERLVIHSSTA